MEPTGIRQPSLPARAFRLYYEGFRNMTLGRTLWKIILIKLIIMFGILKVFFFPDFLNTQFSTDAERADHVLEQITSPAKESNSLTGGKRLW
jgi:hypothetical protein